MTGKEKIMNYFALISVFMIPGMVVGGMASALVRDAMEKRRKVVRRKR